MTTLSCGCVLMASSQEAHLQRCRLHTHAPALLSEAKKALTVLQRYGVPTEMLRNVISLAEGQA